LYVTSITGFSFFEQAININRKKKLKIFNVFIIKNINFNLIKKIKSLKNEVTFRPATFSSTIIEIGFPPRLIKRQLYFTQQKEKTPIQTKQKKNKEPGFLSSFMLLGNKKIKFFEILNYLLLKFNLSK
tara:strand:+ start:186 stop:569 length:384 start_codon:yes stop_codon:yes gene_type:complete